MTGILNRRGFIDWLTRKQEEQVYGLLVILDLDDFKYVNDTFGHEVGDAILVEVGKRLCNFVNVKDLVVRWGGDEFLVVIPSMQLSEARNYVVELHQHVINHPITILDPKQDIVVRASIGVAEGRIQEDLFRQADHVLLGVKRHGKNRVGFMGEFDQQKMQRQQGTIELLRPNLQWVGDSLLYLMAFSLKGFLLTDENHLIVESNTSFQKMSGYSRLEIIGQKPACFASPDHFNTMQYPVMYSMLEKQGFWEGQFVNRRPDGTTWYANEMITEIRVGDQVIGYWALVTAEEVAL